MLMKVFNIREKHLMQVCLEILQSKPISLVDAYILATSQKRNIDSVYSYDGDLAKQGLRLLEIK